MFLFHHSTPFFKAIKQAEKWDLQLNKGKLRVVDFNKWLNAKVNRQDKESLKQLKEKVFVIDA